MAPRVRVENLVKRFGEFVAVDHISFQVEEGEIFGFLGSNGAGKSTTIRILCGLLPPSGGRAWVQGWDVYTQAPLIKSVIGYMSQRFSLYDELTVEENLDFFSGIYGVPSRERESRREQLLELLQLAPFRHNLTRSLAAGWKQRLALGCAVLHRPPILFLDEPTSGVDPFARRTFWELIHELSGAGHTIFVTTHHMDEASYCHRLALMHQGKIVALDSPDRLVQEAAPFQLVELLTEDPLRALQLASRESYVLDVGFHGGGLHVRVDDLERALRRLPQRLQEEGVRTHRCRPVPPSLEDVFTYLIQEHSP